MAYFAYVDKSMESRIQVEQIIGRLLRQPNRQQFTAERLNTAHFYVRVDRSSVFDELIQDVSRKLRAGAPTVKVVAKTPNKQKPTETGTHPRTRRRLHRVGTQRQPRPPCRPRRRYRRCCRSGLKRRTLKSQGFGSPSCT